MISWCYFRLFSALFLYRYLRYVINLVAFVRFRPIQPPEDPQLSSQDVTVILPSLEGDGSELMETIRSILAAEPFEIILVTIKAKEQRAKEFVKSMDTSRVRVLSVDNPNKRRQMVKAIPAVKTKITIFADDDVTWPSTILKWILAPFDTNERYGGVATCQRLRRKENMSLPEWVWGYLDALYLERRNFDCAATTYMDGGVPCLSGRTVAYRTEILQNPEFTQQFCNEHWLFNYQLNADDDNFITRWMVSRNWETYIQYHPEAEVLTTLEDNPKFLYQCLRWARSNWRSNLKTMFWERHTWRRQPYSTYAVQLTTLSPPAFIGDFLLVFLCHKTLEQSQFYWSALICLAVWMFISKFIKLMGHYIRYPVDFLLLPVSILFGYCHGIIKMHAMLTLSNTAWGSRDEADTDDGKAARIYRIPPDEHRPSYFNAVIPRKRAHGLPHDSISFQQQSLPLCSEKSIPETLPRSCFLPPLKYKHSWIADRLRGYQPLPIHEPSIFRQ